MRSRLCSGSHAEIPAPCCAHAAAERMARPGTRPHAHDPKNVASVELCPLRNARNRPIEKKVSSSAKSIQSMDDMLLAPAYAMALRTGIHTSSFDVGDARSCVATTLRARCLGKRNNSSDGALRICEVLTLSTTRSQSASHVERPTCSTADGGHREGTTHSMLGAGMRDGCCGRRKERRAPRVRRACARARAVLCVCSLCGVQKRARSRHFFTKPDALRVRLLKARARNASLLRALRGLERCVERTTTANEPMA